MCSMLLRLFLVSGLFLNLYTVDSRELDLGHMDHWMVHHGVFSQFGPKNSRVKSKILVLFHPRRNLKRDVQWLVDNLPGLMSRPDFQIVHILNPGKKPFFIPIKKYRNRLKSLILGAHTQMSYGMNTLELNAWQKVGVDWYLDRGKEITKRYKMRSQNLGALWIEDGELMLRVEDLHKEGDKLFDYRLKNRS